MDEERFVGEVMRLAAFESREQAEWAISATLATLGELLYEDEVRALAEHLPPSIGRRLEGHPHAGDFDRRELYDRVARREGTALGFGIEHVEVVCRVVGEAQPEEVRARLCRHLPKDLAELFCAPPAPQPPPPRVHHAQEERMTLASGRPGSAHPLSESRPPLAQRHSVVLAENPHEDSKLSSSSGLTQERLDESMAGARPEHGRSLSEGRE